MMGRAVDACTNAMCCEELDSDVINQEAPTACTKPPKLEDIDANQMLRNIGTENGDIGFSCMFDRSWKCRLTLR